MFRWVAFVLFLLPAFAVKAAPMEHRVTWALVISAIFFVPMVISMVVRLVAPSMMAVKLNGPYVRRYGKLMRRATIIFLLVAELLAIVFTYGYPSDGFIGELADIVAVVGAALVPAIAKYAVLLKPPLPADLLLRVQAILTVFLIALGASSIIFLFCVINMPIGERLELENCLKPFRRTSLERSMLFLSVGFVLCVLMSADRYFGWLDFSSVHSHVNRHVLFDCLMRSRCSSVNGDIVIMLAALLRSVIVFGFPLGALAMIIHVKCLKEAEVRADP